VKIGLLISLSVTMFLVGCSQNDINDKSKRNQYWAWWIDAKTGKAQWIPLSDHPTWQNGDYTEFYFDGQIHSKGRIKDGKNVDTTYLYDLKGDLYSYSYIEDDSTKFFFIHNGPIKIYNGSGKLWQVAIIQDHNRYGGNMFAQYYDNGRLDVAFNYSNGIGWHVEYYENGNLKDSSFTMDSIFKTNNSYHTYKKWDGNGQLYVSYDLKNGKYNGMKKVYYVNGQIQEALPYVDDKPEGTATDWYESGKIKDYINFKDSIREGVTTVYYESGQIEDIGNFKNDLLMELKSYDEDGKLIKDTLFENGKKVEF